MYLRNNPDKYQPETKQCKLWTGRTNVSHKWATSLIGGACGYLYVSFLLGDFKLPNQGKRNFSSWVPICFFGASMYAWAVEVRCRKIKTYYCCESLCNNEDHLKTGERLEQETRAMFVFRLHPYFNAKQK